MTTHRHFDLVLLNGDVFDPTTGAWMRCDVGFTNGRIAAIEPSLATVDARQVERVDGCIVTAGLVDMHAHVFYGVGESGDPDDVCLRRGTSTVADGGSAGAFTFGAFRRVADAADVRVLAWLNLSTIGLADTNVPELMAALHMDVEAAVETALMNRDIIVGFKARLSTYATGGSCDRALSLLLRAANEAELPAMAHIGDTFEPLSEILPRLRCGDVVTHCFTGRRHGIVDPHGRLLEEVVSAQHEGLVFDWARGRNHVAFPVVEAALAEGFLPDCLSTDITAPAAAADPLFSLPAQASVLLAFGCELDAVLTRMTIKPADVIGRSDLGRFEVGGLGDAAVLRIREDPCQLRDTDGRTLETRRWLEPVAAVRDCMYHAAVATQDTAALA